MAEALPPEVARTLAVALDPNAALPARRRAISTLERAPGHIAVDVARALVVLFNEGPDLAARAHVAVIALCARLAVGRDDLGAYVASSLLFDDEMAGPAIDDVLGRVVRLDRLVDLQVPGEDLPLFLQPPERPLPPSYRRPQDRAESHHADALNEYLADLRVQQGLRDQQRRARLQALGLDDDDLEDDDEIRSRRVRRPGIAMPTSVPLPSGLTMSLWIDDEEVSSLGQLRAGRWHHAVGRGDARAARRFMLALDVDEALPWQSRRDGVYPVREGKVAVVAGDYAVEFDVTGRSVATAVDVLPSPDGDQVIALAITWTSSQPWRPGGKVAPEPRPARKYRS